MRRFDEYVLGVNEQAVHELERSKTVYSECKDDIMECVRNLEMLPGQISFDAMVPLGPRAMMRGKIVHTNEFLVSIGDSYFITQTAKQAISICERKIEKFDAGISLVEKQLSFLKSKCTVPVSNDAFGSEERPEITEHVTEEEHKAWHKAHRQKEKEYRKKLAEIRMKEKTEIKTDDDLWCRLDELELEEELEEELDRLVGLSDERDMGEDDEEDVTESSSDVEAIEKSVEEEIYCPKLTTPTNFDGKRKRKVIFAGAESEELNEPLFLHFTHSKEEPSQTESGGIVSPKDIHAKYYRDLKRKPPTIMRVKMNPNRDKEFQRISCEEKSVKNSDFKGISMGIQLLDISEKKHFDVVKVNSVVEKPKKVSRFKVSRMKKDLSS